LLKLLFNAFDLLIFTVNLYLQFLVLALFLAHELLETHVLPGDPASLLQHARLLEQLLECLALLVDLLILLVLRFGEVVAVGLLEPLVLGLELWDLSLLGDLNEGVVLELTMDELVLPGVLVQFLPRARLSFFFLALLALLLLLTLVLLILRGLLLGLGFRLTAAPAPCLLLALLGVLNSDLRVYGFLTAFCLLLVAWLLIRH